MEKKLEESIFLNCFTEELSIMVYSPCILISRKVDYWNVFFFFFYLKDESSHYCDFFQILFTGIT